MVSNFDIAQAYRISEFPMGWCLGRLRGLGSSWLVTQLGV